MNNDTISKLFYTDQTQVDLLVTDNYMSYLAEQKQSSTEILSYSEKNYIEEDYIENASKLKLVYLIPPQKVP